jgi:hypothetical protein
MQEPRQSGSIYRKDHPIFVSGSQRSITSTPKTMADPQLIPVNVPTQIGKIGAPGKSCWVKLIGTPAVADGGSYGTGNVTSFCVDSENVYTWDNQLLYCNSVQLNIAEPNGGVFLMRVHNKTAYIWCNNLEMYTLSLDPLAAVLAKVTWEGDSLLPTPVAMVPSGTGWLLTQDNEGQTRLSKWTKADGINTLSTIDLQDHDGATVTPTALALIDQTLYVADDAHIYSVAKEGTYYVASSVLTYPTAWGGITGMLGQKAAYNDPATDGGTAFSHYLYVVDKAAGKVQLVYPAYGKHSDTGVQAHQGDTVFGNLQLDRQGLLYYLQGAAAGDIRTVNVLDNRLFYLDELGEAHNGITLLPNRLMGCQPSQPLTIDFYDEDAPTTQIGSVALNCQAQKSSDGQYLYDKTFFQALNQEQVEVEMLDPYGLTHGPAIVIEFVETDGNIIIGDILVDPHVHHPIHPGKHQ